MRQTEQQRVFLPNFRYGLVPVELYLLSNCSLIFLPSSQGFSPTYEDYPDGVSSFFHEDGFNLWEPGSDVYEYKYNTFYLYKQMPLMRGWLVQQQLSDNQ